ncbi:MAG: cytochrome c family protein [Alphaproteobacteria bacterium]|nr:cytochrome c family protein [Alphaproteobacteria bacterium]
MKDPLLINKIAASVLTALFIMLMIDFVVDEILLKDTGGHGETDGDHAETDDKAKFAYYIDAGEVATTATVVEEEVITPITPLLASADVVAGEKVAKKCAACHTFAEGGQNRIGPNQWDIINRALGTTEGFAYSEALLAKGGAWDYESLNEFIYNPKKYIPNTKMNFAGIKNDKDRANLILWIRSLSNSPVPLP